jgi:hypothetical protein
MGPKKGILSVLVMLGSVQGLSACPSLEYDLNDAVLAVTPEGQAESTLSHEPGRSEVRITPPVDGAFTATFSYLDPHSELRIGVEDGELVEGASLSFPLDAERATLRVDYQGLSLDAAAAEAEGLLTIERLDVGDDRVSFRASFQGTLLTGDGAKAAASGYIDAIYDGASER